MANGAAICAPTSKTNKWSLTPALDFFTIRSRQDTKVLEAGPRETLKRRNQDLLLCLYTSYFESYHHPKTIANDLHHYSAIVRLPILRLHQVLC
jgi:hypothetical protein